MSKRYKMMVEFHEEFEGERYEHGIKAAVYDNFSDALDKLTEYVDAYGSLSKSIKITFEVI